VLACVVMFVGFWDPRDQDRGVEKSRSAGAPVLGKLLGFTHTAPFVRCGFDFGVSGGWSVRMTQMPFFLRKPAEPGGYGPAQT
jgi:hypothetical protein